LLTPNHHEAARMVGMKSRNEDAFVERVGRKLMRKLAADRLLITRGEEGMSLFLPKGDPVHIPTVARRVFDVTGAGDTVIAVLALSLASGAGLVEAAMLANYGAGVVVGEVGTAACTAKQLHQAVAAGYSTR